MTTSTQSRTGRRFSEDELREIAARGAAELGDSATPEELLRWTAETFGDNFVVASNMQDAALVDLAVKNIDRELLDGDPVKVLFLDTGYHFAETIGTRDAVEQVYNHSAPRFARPGVEMVNLTPEQSVAEQDELLGRNLFARDPGECCRLRKVVPLEAALAGFDGWISHEIFNDRFRMALPRRIAADGTELTRWTNVTAQPHATMDLTRRLSSVTAGETAALVGELEQGGADAIVAGGEKTPSNFDEVGNHAAFDLGTD